MLVTQIIYQSPCEVSFRGVFFDMTDYSSSIRWEVRHYHRILAVEKAARHSTTCPTEIELEVVNKRER